MTQTVCVHTLSSRHLHTRRAAPVTPLDMAIYMLRTNCRSEVRKCVTLCTARSQASFQVSKSCVSMSVIGTRTKKNSSA